MANTEYRRDFMDWGGLPYGDMVHPDLFNYGDADDDYPGLEKVLEKSLGDYDRKRTFPLSSFSDVVQDAGTTWKTTVSGHVYITGYYTYINPQSFTLNDGNYLYYTTGNAFLESSALGVHGILIGKRIGTAFQNLLNGIKATGTTGYLHYHGEQQYFIAPVDFNTTGHFLTKAIFSTGAGAIISSDNYDLHATIGRGIIGFATGMSEQFSLGHRDVFTSSNYALAQTSAGYTKVNSASAISLRSADTEYFGVSSTGGYSPIDNYTFAYGYSKLYSASSTAYFVHRSIATPGTQFAICQNAAGYTCVNAVTALSLRSVNTEYIGISATGIALTASNINISSDYFGVSSTGINFATNPIISAMSVTIASTHYLGVSTTGINLVASPIFSTDGNRNYFFGNSLIGTGCYDNNASFLHRDMEAVRSGYAIRQTSAGLTYVNSNSGSVYIETGGRIVRKFNGLPTPIPQLTYGIVGSLCAFASNGYITGRCYYDGSAYPGESHIYYPIDVSRSGIYVRYAVSGNGDGDWELGTYLWIQSSTDGGTWSTVSGVSGLYGGTAYSVETTGLFYPYTSLTPSTSAQYRLTIRLQDAGEGYAWVSGGFKIYAISEI